MSDPESAISADERGQSLGFARVTQSAREARNWVIARGIKVMCGSSVTIDPEGLADIPLVSAGLRLAWLRALRLIGIRQIVATSGFGHPFVCRIGDLSEHPFYHRRAYQKELELCAAWLREGQDATSRQTTAYDIGANDGFFSCQLSQMIGGDRLKIYAFEAVPETFAGLVTSVQRLGLEADVFPVAAAVTDTVGPTRISYAPGNSLCAQVTPNGLNERIGNRLAHAIGMTVERFQEGTRGVPALLKIDVEGSEPAVLRGAQSLLARDDRPAMLFEFNPLTLSECGENLDAFAALLSGYKLHYVDDLERQKIPFGGPVADLRDIRWICNIFAVPDRPEAATRFAAALAKTKQRIAA